MPTVAVDKEDLWERLEYRYSKPAHIFVYGSPNPTLAPEEFDKLLFDFGLELDEDVGATRTTLVLEV